MSTGSGIKYSTPDAVKGYLNQANTYIGQEADRLSALQAALTGSVPDVARALGINLGGDPTISRMVGTLLGGGELKSSDYADLLKSGAAPDPVADPGARPVEYKQTFAANGYKNWGKNDQRQQDESLKAIQQWEQKNAAYQQYLQRKATYDAQPADESQFNLAKTQAQYIADQYNQAKDQGGQLLASRQALLDQLRSIVTAGPGDQTFQNELSVWQNGGTQDFQTALTGAQSTLASQQGLLDRIMSGDWSANPALLKELEQQKQTVMNRLIQQLGPGWQTSTAGIETLGNYDQARAAAIGQNYQSDLANQQGLVGAAQQNLLNLQQWGSAQEANSQARVGEQQRQYLAQLQGLLSQYANTGAAQSGAFANALNAQSGLLGYGSQLGDLYNQLAQQPYSVNQGGTLAQLLQQNAAAYGSQTSSYQKPNTLGSILGGVGTAAGTALGAYFGGPFGAMAGAQIGSSLGGLAGGGYRGGTFATKPYYG